jgi:hypothetical protein
MERRDTMDFKIKLTEDELQLVLIALEGNKELQKIIKDQSWKQVKISA